ILINLNWLSQNVFHDQDSNGLSQTNGNGIADLFILLYQATLDLPIVRKLLDSFVFFDTQRSVFLRMGQIRSGHGRMGYKRWGGLIPIQPSIEPCFASTGKISFSECLFLDF